MPPLLYFVNPYLAPEPAPSPAALLDAYDLMRRAVKKEPEPMAAEYELEQGSDEEEGHAVAEPAKTGDVKQALLACKLFLFFAIYNIADGGLNTIMTSMAGSMTTNVSSGNPDTADNRVYQTTFWKRRECIAQCSLLLTSATRSRSCCPFHC